MDIPMNKMVPRRDSPSVMALLPKWSTEALLGLVKMWPI